MNAVKTILIQQASGRYAELLDLSAPLHNAYAARHRLTFWSVRGDVQFEHVPHWNKIVLIQRALQFGFDLAVWLDADTLILRPREDVRGALGDGPPIGMCRHPEPWGDQPWHFNSGVIFVRNTEVSRAFFEHVLQAGPTGHHWHEQARINDAAQKYPEAVQFLEPRWNSTAGVNSCRDPIIRAWHGCGERALELMRGALAGYGSQQRQAAFEVLTANLFEYHRVGYDRRPMSFLPNGCVGIGVAGREFLWDLKEDQGSIVLLLYSHQELTCALTEESGVWRGRWIDFERMPIELTAVSPKAPAHTVTRSRNARAAKPCLIAVATRPLKHYGKFLKSCERYSIEPAILGCGETYYGHGLKFYLMKKFIEEFSAEFSHIISCDAYDVVLSAGLDEILDRFSSFNAPLVFSAEKNCAPDAERQFEYPDSHSPNKFLNAGFWVGETGAVREMFHTAASREIGINDDQRIYTELFLSRQAPIALDYDCRICQSLFWSEEEIEYDAVRRQIVNRLNQNTPCVFHGNGNADMSQVFAWLGL